jgi:hypothetical protein
VKSQLLPVPQVQVPFAHGPAHSGLLPSQLTWHGGASHMKSQTEPVGQRHVPSVQSDPLHAEDITIARIHRLMRGACHRACDHFKP